MMKYIQKSLFFLFAFLLTFGFSYWKNYQQLSKDDLAANESFQSQTATPKIASQIAMIQAKNDNQKTILPVAPFDANKTKEIIEQGESYTLSSSLAEINTLKYYQANPDLYIAQIKNRFKRNYASLGETDLHHRPKLISETTARLLLLEFWQKVSIDSTKSSDIYREILTNQNEAWIVKRKVLKLTASEGLLLNPKERLKILTSVDSRSIASSSMTDEELIKNSLIKVKK